MEKSNGRLDRAVPMTILVVGDANADLTAALASFPREGDDVLVAGMGWHSGGSAANVATALARLSETVQLVARVGRDPAAEVALQIARAAGVDLSRIQYDPVTATGLCMAAISPSGERTLFSYRGANVALEIGPQDTRLLEHVEWLHIAGHALLEGTQRASVEWLLQETAAHAPRIPLSLDLCLPLISHRRNELLELLPFIDILFANELELAALFPERDVQTADFAQASSNGRLVVVKHGAKGCAVFRSGQRLLVPPFVVDAVDTTGCGDAFVAGFLFGYLRQESPLACATLANAVGALSATRHGAAEALPSRSAVREFLGEHPLATLLRDGMAM